MALQNDTENIEKDEIKTFDNCIGIYNRSDVAVLYSFLPFGAQRLGLEIAPRSPVEFPKTTIYIKVVGASASIEVIRDV